jgi:hypothetical protein
MTSNYNPVSDAQPFEQWLEEVVIELSEVGLPEKLTLPEHRWFLNTWEQYDLSPAEAVLSFINETPA